MVAIRIESVAPPWAEPEIAMEAAALLGRVEAMGLLDEIAPITHIDTESMGNVFAVLRDRGLVRFLDVGTLAWPSAGALSVRPSVGTTDHLLQTLRQVFETLEDSAVPHDEWRHLRDVLGEDLLARLCVISLPSLRRYASGTRTTPDEVASRLHAVALLLADLAGAYNDFGTRRWFLRPRIQLGGRSPSQVLTGQWSPDDPDVQKVRDLARSITASPAA